MSDFLQLFEAFPWHKKLNYAENGFIKLQDASCWFEAITPLLSEWPVGLVAMPRGLVYQFIFV